MKSVLFLQNEIMQYRKPVYNGLAEFYDVSVFHSGQPSVIEGDRYREHIAPQIRRGPFHVQPASPLDELIGSHDAVIAMFDIRWPRYLAPLFWRRRPKYILWGHRYGNSGAANAVRDFLMKHADCLLLYGDEEVERMVSRGIPRSRIVLAPNTIDVPNHFDYSKHPKTSFLFVGRLQQRKRLDLLISSFAKAYPNLPPHLSLDIVGAGPIETELKQQAQSAGIVQRVNFYGKVHDPVRLADLFSRAIAYVSPGPVGLGVLHSFAYGVPVVTLRKERHGPEFWNLRHDENSHLLDTEQDLTPAFEFFASKPSHAAALGHNAFIYYTRERNLSKMLTGIRQGIEG
jgi:glycosyltransferase involved in cell wall biosynthesis